MAARGRAKKLDAEGLWNFALTALAGRAHSIAELRSKLLPRAQALSDVSATLARLREYGMLDDGKFSEAFAASRLTNQGQGKMRVLRDLRTKRVSADAAQRAVEATFAGTDEQQLAQNYLERKYRGKDLKTFLQEEKNFAAAFRRLRLGGFRSSTILAILKRYNTRADEFDPTEEDPQE